MEPDYIDLLYADVERKKRLKFIPKYTNDGQPIVKHYFLQNMLTNLVSAFTGNFQTSSQQNSIVFNVKHTDSKEFKQYIHDLNNQFFNMSYTSLNQMVNKSTNSNSLEIDELIGDNNKLVFTDNHTINFNDCAEETQKLLLQAYDIVRNKIVNDLRSLFESKSANDLLQKFDVKEKRGVISQLASILSGVIGSGDGAQTIKNLSTSNQNVEKKVDEIFDMLNENNETQSFRQDFVKNYFNELNNVNNIIIKKINGNNLDLEFGVHDKFQTFFEQLIHMNVVFSIFKDLNKSRVIEIDAKTLDELTETSRQELKSVRKDEGIYDFLYPIAYGLVGVGLIGTFGYLFYNNTLTSSEPSTAKADNMIELNLPKMLADKYFGDEQDEIEIKRLLFAKNNLVKPNQEMQKLLTYLKKSNIDVTNPNSVWVSIDLLNTNQNKKKTKFDNSVLVQEFDKLEPTNKIETATSSFLDENLVKDVVFNDYI
jgi:hypothetical protein